jgi:hypothetical protein
MWNARPRRVTSRGHTLVEASIVVFLVATVSIVLHGAVTATSSADSFLGAMRSAAERSDKIGYEVSSLVNTSRKLFQGDDVGKAYLAALQLPLAVAPTARLPVIAEDEVLDDDTVGTPMTGNILLFVREADPAPAVANPLLGIVRHIDTYRFVCIYPHQTANQLVPERPDALDLVIWRSVVFPSWQQVTEIQDATQRKNVLKDLHKRFGYRQAWNPDGASNASFYTFQADGNIDGSPTATFQIKEDPAVSEQGRLVYARTQLARTEASGFAARAVLSQDDPSVWMPNGFEVKVTGASRSRQAWIHLVLEVPEPGGHRTAVLASTLIANCQDL